jgi:hypothetical protein
MIEEDEESEDDDEKSDSKVATLQFNKPETKSKKITLPNDQLKTMSDNEKARKDFLNELSNSEDFLKKVFHLYLKDTLGNE